MILLFNNLMLHYLR